MRPGNSIYKYCAFSKLALDILENSRLYGNHYSAFNDPFECWCIERTGIPDPEKERGRFLNVISAWGFNKERANDALEFYHEYLEEFDHDYSFRIEGHLNQARISCFCENIDNLLMWSHYADGLRGFAIEFDRKEVVRERENVARILRVKYRKSPAVIDSMVFEVANDQIWYNENAIDEYERGYISHGIEDHKKALVWARRRIFNLYAKMFATKPFDWKYEQEARLIFFSAESGQKGEFYSYPKDAIKSVIVGERVTDSHMQELKIALSNAGLAVPVRKAYRDKNNFKVVIE